MDKAEATKLLRRMYKEIRRGEIKFTIKCSPGIAGKWEPNPSVPTVEYEIELNPREDILPTLIHEMLHHLFPEKRHSWIDKTEKQMVELLSDRQMKNLCKSLGDVI